MGPLVACVSSKISTRSLATEHRCSWLRPLRYFAETQVIEIVSWDPSNDDIRAFERAVPCEVHGFDFWDCKRGMLSKVAENSYFIFKAGRISKIVPFLSEY